MNNTNLLERIIDVIFQCKLWQVYIYNDIIDISCIYVDISYIIENILEIIW